MCSICKVQIQPRTETWPRPCRVFGSHPATWAIDHTDQSLSSLPDRSRWGSKDRWSIWSVRRAGNLLQNKGGTHRAKNDGCGICRRPPYDNHGMNRQHKITKKKNDNSVDGSAFAPSFRFVEKTSLEIRPRGCLSCVLYSNLFGAPSTWF